MRLRLTVILALALALVAGSRPAYANHVEDQKDQIDQILALVREGVSEDIVVKEIQASGFVFDLTADDILDLRDLGLGDRVIEAMLDTAIQDGRRRHNYDSRDDGGYYGSGRYGARSDWYFSLSVGYFSPWYQYPYAWGFYYDPFPVYYSAFYYPFRFGDPWGYYGNCHNYWYRRHWGSHRFDDPSLYPGRRWVEGGAIRVKRPPVPRYRQAVAPENAQPRGRLAVSPPESGSRRERAVVPRSGQPRGRLQVSPPEAQERRRIYRREVPEDRRTWRERPRQIDLAPRPQPPAARHADSPAPPPGRPPAPERSFVPRSAPPQAQPPHQREFEHPAPGGPAMRAPATPPAPSGRARTRG